MKSTQCVLRNVRGKDESIHGWIGGWMAGLGLFFEQRKRRSELMLYCAPRGLQIVWQLLERKQYIKYIRHGEVNITLRRKTNYSYCHRLRYFVFQ